MENVTPTEIIESIEQQKQRIAEEVDSGTTISEAIQKGRELHALDWVKKIMESYRWRFVEIENE